LRRCNLTKSNKSRVAAPQLDFLRIVLLTRRILRRLIHFFGHVFRLAAPQLVVFFYEVQRLIRHLSTIFVPAFPAAETSRTMQRVASDTLFCSTCGAANPQKKYEKSRERVVCVSRDSRNLSASGTLSRVRCVWCVCPVTRETRPLKGHYHEWGTCGVCVSRDSRNSSASGTLSRTPDREKILVRLLSGLPRTRTQDNKP